MMSFTSGKFRIDDWERLLNLGFTRSGNYFYFRDTHKSCCDIYQYRVDISKFKMSSSQKKVMRRFYRYLLEGKRPKDEDNKEGEEEEEKKSPRDERVKVPMKP
jgi:arginine-tRNA-protein transferase